MSYAKLPGAENGQIASSLRQVCYNLLRNNPELIKPITGVDQKGRETIDGYAIGTIVTAFVSPDNEDPMRVLEAAGFVRQKNDVMWDEEDIGNPEVPEDHFYVLDWNKLLEITAKKANTQVFKDRPGPEMPQSFMSVVPPQFEGQVMASEPVASSTAV